MGTKVYKSYAKINISLNVTKKREDGYHELDMVMLPIELHDSILISRDRRKTKDHFITIDDFSVNSQQYNTVAIVMEKLQKKYKFDDKFNIFVHKNIPIQAGLGGGSSNAAFTARAVNNILKLGASSEELRHLVEKLGGDVPFFVDCKPSRCRGIGEVCTPITVKNDYYVLVVKPKEGCSTKDVYDVCDKMELETYDIDKVIACLENGDDEELANCIGNALEKPALTFAPAISEIKDKLKALGLKIVLMSGSGSSVFALSTDKKLINTAFNDIEGDYTVIKTRVIK